MGVTLKFQTTGMVPGDGRPVSMQGGSLTVGRGPANDLVLPDPDKTLSKSHFAIEDQAGSVVVVDLSTNGTFLNYSKIPLGRTPTPLSNGDVLIAGGYEMVVEIGADLPSFEQMIPAPAAQGGVSHGVAGNAPDPLALLDDAPPGGDFLDDLLGDETPKGPGQIDIPDPIDDLLPPMEDDDPFFQKPSDGMEGEGASEAMHSPSPTDAFAAPSSGGGSFIPDDWDDDLLSPSEPEPPAPVAKPTPGAQQPPAPLPTSEEQTVLPPSAPAQPERTAPVVPADAKPASAAPAAAGDSSAARAFLEALELDDVRIDDADLPATMGRMGRVLRAMVTGLREILMTRTSIKSEFRIDQTMIGAGGNNPLKFSISPEQAIEAMVKPRVRGYLGSEEATKEALDDIKAHQVAMITGMEAALKGVLSRLDPEQVAGKIETSGALGSLFRGKKARYWEIYEKMYAEISDQAENEFHDLFSREFARAYKEQLEKLK
ncbi:type VI secretion system-associated FHA domain protein TagH [Ruegeria sp. 2205SS24-7]|uniref:type VI secretion system-associated FHA domain protein TagH n=1 Tax=Ruegeria discodermiae TaxID=3064389 RepID=UPI002741438C|nr:type VI secretion system-associated FHA domain protein TagH [Ruegeria sp. 2205SS24-7]MDP5217205.1 type VI secretion system-associated FHA domain protein TagH [Ruegeria sp. 2205SS24-7]